MLRIIERATSRKGGKFPGRKLQLKAGNEGQEISFPSKPRHGSSNVSLCVCLPTSDFKFPSVCFEKKSSNVELEGMSYESSFSKFNRTAAH